VAAERADDLERWWQHLTEVQQGRMKRAVTAYPAPVDRSAAGFCWRVAIPGVDVYVNRRRSSSDRNPRPVEVVSGEQDRRQVIPIEQR
jgi:hypothetical protein